MPKGQYDRNAAKRRKKKAAKALIKDKRLSVQSNLTGRKRREQVVDEDDIFPIRYNVPLPKGRFDPEREKYDRTIGAMNVGGSVVYPNENKNAIMHIISR